MVLPNPQADDAGTDATLQRVAEDTIGEDKYKDIGQATARDGLALVPNKVLKLLHLA
jgi:hypothetical protein